jgi:hypothetical protein
MPRKPAIPDEVRRKASHRLKRLVKKYRKHGVADIIGIFKGRYLYVGWTDEASILIATLSKRKLKPSKLCRLKYKGDINNWELEMYKYSDMCYDVEGDFMFSGGTIKKCFDAAASVYITETIDR